MHVVFAGTSVTLGICHGAVLALVLMYKSGHAGTAMRAFYKLAEQIGFFRSRIRFGITDRKDHTKLFLRDVRFTVSGLTVAHPRINLTGKHSVDLVCSGGTVSIGILRVCNGFPL